MATSNTERLIYAEIQKKLFYMIPERWEAIYLYASIIEEDNKKPVGEMYFYYIPKGILKRKPVNVYEIPGLFNIEEESYNELIQKLYFDIKELRNIHKELKTEIWSNLTITIKNNQFKVEFDYADLGVNALFNPYERHVIWRYNNLNDYSMTTSREEKNIIERYLHSTWSRTDYDRDIYVEGIYRQQVRNIIDYERTMTIEAAIAAQREEEKTSSKNKKVGKKKAKDQKLNNTSEKNENNNQILFGRVDHMRQTADVDPKKVEHNSISMNERKQIGRPVGNKKIVKKPQVEDDFDDDIILSSDFMTKK